MLNIYFGEMPEAIYQTDVYFRNTYEDEWITDGFAREVIKKVDKSDVIDREAIKSPVLGIISPDQLSQGAKTLILIKNCPDKIFNVSCCGDNCARFILKLARTRDITVNLRHYMNLGKTKFSANVLNNGRVVHGMEELLFAAAEYV